MTFTGGCLCGEVRWRVDEAPANVRACHCVLCRKVSGGPFHVRAIFRKDAVIREGETGKFRSSSRLWRHFCPVCSVYLFGEPLDRPEYISVNVATFDDPDAVAPDMHIWTSAKIGWVKLDDGLPQYPEGHPW